MDKVINSFFFFDTFCHFPKRPLAMISQKKAVALQIGRFSKGLTTGPLGFKVLNPDFFQATHQIIS